MTIESRHVGIIHFHSCISSDTVVAVLSLTLGNGHNLFLNIKIKFHRKREALVHADIRRVIFKSHL